MCLQKLLTLFVSFLILFSFQKLPAQSTRLSPVLGVRSHLVHRGALTWDDPVGLAAIGIDAWGFFSIGADGLALYQTRNRHTLKLALSGFDDSSPSYPAINLTNNKEEGLRNSRPATYELALKYSYSLGFLVGSFDLHKDMNEHFGLYSKAGIILRLIPFTSINASIGYGTLEHNRYLYGPQAQAGLADYALSIGNRFSFLPWNGFLITSIGINKIIKSVNNSSDLVKNQKDPVILTVMGIWAL